MSIERIGSDGSISLGKEFAGQTVFVKTIEPGVWIVKVGRFVPDSELWLWQEGVQESLARAETYIVDYPAKASDIKVLDAGFTTQP